MEDIIITIINGIVSVDGNDINKGNDTFSVAQMTALLSAQDALHKVISTIANSTVTITEAQCLPADV